MVKFAHCTSGRVESNIDPFSYLIHLHVCNTSDIAITSNIRFIITKIELCVFLISIRTTLRSC